jgi:hypothetical protein
MIYIGVTQMETMTTKPKRRLTSYAEPELGKRIDKLAKLTQRSESQVIEMLLKKALGLPGGMLGAPEQI